MSTLCDNMLSADIMASCTEVGELGFRKRGYIFNFDDVDRTTTGQQVTEEGNLIQILLYQNKKGYRIEQLGKQPFEGTNTALVVGAYRNSFTNQVKIFIPDNDSCAPVVDSIATGKFIVVLDNGVGGFRVYGYYNGLTATEITQTPYSEETDAGWVVTLEETKAMCSRVTLGMTKKEIEALCNTIA